MKNYITPTGVQMLTTELNQLLWTERPKTVQDVATAAAHGDRSENAEYKYGKRRLREIDRRIRFLQKRLDSAAVVDPKAQSGDVVFFGAHVLVEDEDGVQKRYHLVGEDETAPEIGKVSWRSPIGRSLLKRTVGDFATVRRPAGEIELEVISVDYGWEPEGG